VGNEAIRQPGKNTSQVLQVLIARGTELVLSGFNASGAEVALMRDIGKSWALYSRESVIRTSVIRTPKTPVHE